MKFQAESILRLMDSYTITREETYSEDVSSAT
jgi:hypothetical protein